MVKFLPDGTGDAAFELVMEVDTISPNVNASDTSALLTVGLRVDIAHPLLVAIIDERTRDHGPAVVTIVAIAPSAYWVALCPCWGTRVTGSL